MANSVACEINPSFYAYSTHLLYPTPDCIAFSQRSKDDDDTFIASNLLYSKLFRSGALDHSLDSKNFAGAMMPLKTGSAIADSGAMQIFVIEGTPAIKKGSLQTLYSVAC
jgi:hypothetical protein